MTEDDDLVPEPSEPRMRKVKDGFGCARGTGKCGHCPKLDRPRLWCPIQATHRTGTSPACRYGMALMERQRGEK